MSEIFVIGNIDEKKMKTEFLRVWSKFDLEFALRQDEASVRVVINLRPDLSMENQEAVAPSLNLFYRYSSVSNYFPSFRIAII